MRALVGPFPLVCIVIAGLTIGVTTQNIIASNATTTQTNGSDKTSAFPVASTNGGDSHAASPGPLSFFKRDMPVWVNNLIGLGQAVIAFENLVAIIWFFCRTNNDHRRERAQDRAERAVRIQQEVGNFWIKELILKSGNEFVHRFFDKYESEIAAFRLSCGTTQQNVESLRQNAATKVEEFKNEFHQLNKRVVEPLEWVSPEFAALRPVMRDLEDLVTEEFGTLRLQMEGIDEGNAETPEIKYRQLRSEFFKRLHTAHKKFVGI